MILSHTQASKKAPLSLFFLIFLILPWQNGESKELNVQKLSDLTETILPSVQETINFSDTFKIEKKVYVDLPKGYKTCPESLGLRFDKLKKLTGCDFYFNCDSGDANIQLQWEDQGSYIPGQLDEAYWITIQKEHIVLKAYSETGFYWALITLEQLMTPLEKTLKQPQGFSLPCGQISDAPWYSWRGLMIDSCRHFQSPDRIIQILEWMTLYKLNRFHWHLTDDQGWRIEIPEYPMLTRIGAWRKELDGHIYGGFYSLQDIKRILKEADRRHITVIPEIDFPGHSSAALAAYPELSNSWKKRKVPAEWGGTEGVLCIGKAEVNRFVRIVAKSIFETFPGTWVHWGGDEVYYSPWLRNKESLKWMKKNRLKTSEDVYKTLWNELENLTLDAGKIPIGWEETNTASGSKKTIIQWWKDPLIPEQVSLNGRKMIISWCDSFYLDYPEYSWVSERQNWMSVTDFNHIESFKAQLKNIPYLREQALGVEACLWTERVTDGILERKIFPRLAAVADTAWLGGNNLSDSNRQLEGLKKRLTFWGIGIFQSEK